MQANTMLNKVQHDHHGIVAEVSGGQGRAAAATWIVALLAIVSLSLPALQVLPGPWVLAVYLPLALTGVGVLGAMAWRGRRVVVRVSHEYLVVEERPLLRSQRRTRIALGHIHGATVRCIGRGTLLALEVDKLGTVEVPFRDRQEALQLCEQIRSAAASAPDPELHRVEPPPEALERMRIIEGRARGSREKA